VKPLDLRVEYGKWRNWRKKLGVLLKQMPKPPRPKPKPKPVQLFMYDDVNVSLIPKDAKAVAGYVGGRWPTFPQVVKDFPHAKKLSIAISAIENARCLDVEPGDAQPSQAAEWVRRQHARGEKLPVVYTSASQLQHLVNLLDASGLRYGKDYLAWSAHYTGVKHFCSPKCGFGIKVTAHATQFTDKAMGRSLDESVCAPGFFY
jgi:hypothetical protein